VIARTTFGRTLAVVLSIALSQLAVPLAHAATLPPGAAHAVDSQQLSARLTAHAAERAARVRSIQDALDTSEAKEQAQRLGVPVGRLRAAVPHLSDVELKDLSDRATRVKDVAAGHSSHNNTGLIVLGVTLLVAGLVVIAVAADDDWDDWDDWDDDCWCDY
jgi:hypothetical protein